MDGIVRKELLSIQSPANSIKKAASTAAPNRYLHEMHAGQQQPRQNLQSQGQIYAKSYSVAPKVIAKVQQVIIVLFFSLND